MAERVQRAPGAVRQRIPPVVRILCGVMGLALLYAAAFTFLATAHASRTGILLALVAGCGFCWIAARGFRSR
jgi:hypothetical protein